MADAPDPGWIVGIEPSWQSHARSSRDQEVHMSTSQGLDGTPFMSYYDKVHALSFVWDTTQGYWIDVSYGGYGEPVIARIPINGFGTTAHPIDWTLARFKSACESFINLIHEIEQTTIGHVHNTIGTPE